MERYAVYDNTFMKQLAGLMLLLTMVVNISSCVSLPESGKGMLECRIELVEGAAIRFRLTNASKERLAVLKWKIPFSTSVPLDVFTVTQDQRKVFFSGPDIGYVFDSASSLEIIEPGESFESVVRIRDWCQIEKGKPYTVKYEACLQFRVVGKSHKLRTVEQLNGWDCIESNTVTVK